MSLPRRTVTTLASNIARVFRDNNLTWKIGGYQTVANDEDIQVVLDRAKYEVEYQAVNSHLQNTNPQISMKHLLFKQDESGKVEVFVKMGEIE